MFSGVTHDNSAGILPPTDATAVTSPGTPIPVAVSDVEVPCAAEIVTGAAALSWIIALLNDDPVRFEKDNSHKVLWDQKNKDIL
jgi:hypothetical protein